MLSQAKHTLWSIYVLNVSEFTQLPKLFKLIDTLKNEVSNIKVKVKELEGMLDNSIDNISRIEKNVKSCKSKFDSVGSLPYDQGIIVEHLNI